MTKDEEIQLWQERANGMRKAIDELCEMNRFLEIDKRIYGYGCFFLCLVILALLIVLDAK